MTSEMQIARASGIRIRDLPYPGAYARPKSPHRGLHHVPYQPVQIPPVPWSVPRNARKGALFEPCNHISMSDQRLPRIGCCDSARGTRAIVQQLVKLGLDVLPLSP